jgi:hypothetical protein
MQLQTTRDKTRPPPPRSRSLLGGFGTCQLKQSQTHSAFQQLLLLARKLKDNLSADSGVGKDLEEHAVLDVSSNHVNFFHAIF